MLNLNMNANFNGSSVKDDVVIATFNASYNGEKNIYIGISVEDHALFAAHKAEVDADFLAFTDKVLESVAELED